MKIVKAEIILGGMGRKDKKWRHALSEFGKFERLLNDPAEGLEIKNGVLKVPSTPGIGVSLRS